MSHISILDCTLRDGAQVNEARFGDKAIKDIIYNLKEAGIDIIECGFLKNVEYEKGRTYFPQPSYIKDVLPYDKEKVCYAALMDFGRYDVDALEQYDGETIDIIRISFFEWDLGEVRPFIEKVKKKGYRFTMQPMDTFSYTEDDLKKVIDIANEIRPEALSIVDTYSVADEDKLEEIYDVYRARLDKNIKIGFHSHNSQLNSFGLAKHFMKIVETDRDIIVDASLYGMGRGSGNLNTELFAEYLNKKGIKNYDMKNILDMIDTYLVEFKKEYEWGYNLGMLYAGWYGVHVYTTSYLLNKPNVSSYDLKCMFELLDDYKKKRYDYDYLDGIYEEYMKNKRSKK